MAFTDTKLSYFHSFSKMPAQNGTSLGNAINKSGHTVTASEVWASDIPYFGKMGSLDDVVAKVQPYARKNDMCYITAGADKGKTFQYDGVGVWTDITATLVDGAIIKNAKDEAVLLYHKGKTLTNLTADNNANTDSANNAARLWVTRAKDGSALADGEKRLVEQFVGATDKALNGLASVAYAPVLANGSLVAGTNYYDYCFSGTILWATARTTATVIDCFEYVGEKVSDVVDTVSAHSATIKTHGEEISELKDKLGLSTDTPDGTPTLGGRVTDNETALRVLLGLEDGDKVVATESIATAIDNAVTITGINVKVGDAEASAVTPVDKIVTIEIPEVQAAVVTSGAITTDGFAKASDAKAIAEKAISDSLAGTTEGTIGYEISELDGAISGVSQTVAGIQTSLSTGGDTAKAIAKAQETADEAKGIAETAVQTVTGDTYVTATKTETGVTLATQISVIDSKLAEETSVVGAAIKAAKTAGENASGEVTALSDTTVASQTVAGAGITVTLGGKVGAPTLTGSVTTASYTAATETAAGSWSNESNVVTGANVKAALADVATAHQKDIDTVTAAITALSTSGFQRIVVDELPTSDIQLNAIYLVPFTTAEKDENVYAEYIYVGGSVTDGVVSGGSFEQIGTTKTDLAEYAKSADIEALDATETVNGLTVTQVDGKITGLTETLITASVPAGTTSVEGNIAYVGSEKHVIAPDKFQTAAQMPSTLTSWVADLSNLTDGDNMFKGTALTTFIGDLSSLTSGVDMFAGCTLDTETLEVIADTLPVVSNDPIIDLGSSNSNLTLAIQEVLAEKGWNVRFDGQFPAKPEN